MTISLVLRTKNESASIEKTIEMVRLQPHGSQVELVVVDSGSTDATLAILQRQQGLKIMQISGSEFSYGRALNRGIDAASGDFVVTLSAHAFPADGFWLQSLLRPFADKNVAGVYGRQVAHQNAWPPVQRDCLEYYGDEIVVQTDYDDPRHHQFSNANAAIRKECWTKRRFDENLPYCEDSEWARAMLHLGHRTVYEPTATVYHSHNESFQDVYFRCRKEALAMQQLYGTTGEGANEWIRAWFRSISADFKFIHETGAEKKWFLWAPIYRLYWSRGRSLSATVLGG